MRRSTTALALIALLLLSTSLDAAPLHPRVREVRSLAYLSTRYGRLRSWVEGRIAAAREDVREASDLQALVEIHYAHLLEWGAAEEKSGAVGRAIDVYTRALGVGEPASGLDVARGRIVALRLGEAERLLGAGSDLAAASAHVEAVLALVDVSDADKIRARNMGFKIDSHEADRRLDAGDLTGGYDALAAVIESYGDMELPALEEARARFDRLGRETDLLILRTFDASATVGRTNPAVVGPARPLGPRAFLHPVTDHVAAADATATVALTGNETRVRVRIADGRRFSLRIPFAEGDRLPLRLPVELVKGGATVRLPDRVPERMAWVPEGEGFFIGLHEVTREEMNAWRAATGKRLRRVDRPGFPARELDRADVEGFLGFAGVSLPTVEEWRLAAVGRDGRALPWGGGNARDHANIDSDTGMLEPVDGRAGDVGPYGLHHVLGNVWEIVEGWFALGGSTNTPYPLKLSFMVDGRGADWEPDLLRDPRPLEPAIASLAPEQRRRWSEVLFDKENPGASNVNQEGIGFRVVLRVER